MDERRKHQRIDSHNLVHISIRENEEVVQQGMGRTLNISESGIRLEINFSIKPAHSIWLTIGIKDESVDILGEMVYYIKGDKKHDYGIKFMEMDDSAMNMLKLYIINFNRREKRTEKVL